jgi:uncharacterized protein (DUF885 family)
MRRDAHGISAGLVLLLGGLASLHAGAQGSSADVRFDALAARFVDEMPAYSPVGATQLGDHRFDSELDQVDDAARAAQSGFYARYRADLAALDRDGLSRANKIDAELLRHEIETQIWSLDELQSWAWNPLEYTDLAGSAIYGLLAREFAPLEERLTSVEARLRQLPRFFEQVRESMEPARVPAVHAETALRQHAGLMSLVGTMVIPALDEVSPAARDRLESAIAVARNAADEQQAWLENELLPSAQAEFRLGAELFDRKLGLTLNSAMTRPEIRARAEREYANVREAMYEVASAVYQSKYPYVELPDQPEEALKQAVIRAALEEAYQRLPNRDELVAAATAALEQTTAFVIENDLVSVPDDPIEIVLMPEFQRGVAVACSDSPGPLDVGQKTFYAVAPLPEDWTAEQDRSFLREYNLLSIEDLTIHEAMPGHYLQLAHSNRYPSVLRAVLSSGTFIEGWAVYAERTMIAEGYLEDDPLMRLINLKWYLRTVVNAIIDQAIHVDGMTRDEAMRLMIEGGFQEEREAAGKWTRAQLTSTQLSTYFVGYQEHIDLRREVEARSQEAFSLKSYHDEVLSYGSPPGKYVRALLLDEPIPL